ncbi:MAG: hypothetical protein Q9223_000868 [Gallowayella weberi]
MEAAYSMLVYNAHKTLKDIIKLEIVNIDGSNLDVPSVVAVSKYHVSPLLARDESFRRQINASVETLNKLLQEGETIYGVTTGFGGSADTRTDRTKALQSALLQMQQYGVLAAVDKSSRTRTPYSHSYSHAMPTDWVRGTLLVRSNTVARGHSAVSLQVIEAVIALLQHDLTPVVPLRGSISASGDLSPLSYIAGAITGNPDIYVQSVAGIISAQEALQSISIDPIILGPKEGLGLINGTATSAAVASLAIYETHHITILSHVLTAMALEALLGTVENYDPFIAHIRPHRGQIESAHVIRQFLQGSTLARGFEHDKAIPQSSGLLYQDRYALRTASQWLGPQMEDLLLAHEQITTELNSTTDNPSIDIEGQTTHHGGNFQAVSITSAMEKTRLSLQMIGKLLFAQCSELINPMLNNGLPPNLVADEPSISYTMKGVDIGMASYMSELAFLANPVSSHVQSAEMHNQAVNSLAFISTRYTLESGELVSLMSASYLYTVCQALDLRVLQKSFFQNLEPALYALNQDILGAHISPAALESLHIKLWAYVQVSWLLTSNKDTSDRANYIIDMALAILTQVLFDKPEGSMSEASDIMRSWRSRANSLLVETYTSTRSTFFTHQSTPDHLGCASRRMYRFVRQTLGVPFHKGLEDQPMPNEPLAANGSRKQTIGSWISVIYESLGDGRLHEPLMECLAEAGLIPGVKDADGSMTVDGHDATGDNTQLYTIDEVAQKLSTTDVGPKDPIEEAIRNHSVDEVIVAKTRRASLSLAHGSLTSV